MMLSLIHRERFNCERFIIHLFKKEELQCSNIHVPYNLMQSQIVLIH